MSWSNITSRMDEAIMATVNDGLCQYQGTAANATDAPYILDRDVELFDGSGPDQGVAQLVTTVSIQSGLLGGASRQGDRIITAERSWTVQQTLKDDGHMRQLYVT
ncbi:hypothetical protein GCM10022421_08920 [Oceanisphaera sediminis]|uniref:DUF4440 domain-containing protein n=1 Tax=Oceanisphaera sediminis TaxID=981381 RepID=A0ABP7DDR9_9GAMM